MIIIIDWICLARDTIIYDIIFEVSTAVKIHVVLWVMILCSLVGECLRFEETGCFYLHAVCSTETLVPIYLTTRCDTLKTTILTAVNF
jgi:hypothetical protein